MLIVDSRGKEGKALVWGEAFSDLCQVPEGVYHTTLHSWRTCSPTEVGHASNTKILLTDPLGFRLTVWQSYEALQRAGPPHFSALSELRFLPRNLRLHCLSKECK